MDGLGVLTYPYGEKSVVGEWKNGKEWNTKHRKKDGTLLGKFENGNWYNFLLKFNISICLNFTSLVFKKD